ncbi:hypothetical protein [Dendronalium sp. ChiSLP03b]
MLTESYSKYLSKINYTTSLQMERSEMFALGVPVRVSVSQGEE